MDRLKDEGLSDEDARMAARRSFGNVTGARERFYETGNWFRRDVWRDLQFGFRMLLKNPGSSAIAVLTLALGIGANTAIFSLLNAVLLRNLPVQRPQELALFGKGEWIGSQNRLPDGSWQLFSYPMFREFRAKNSVFTDITAVDSILFGVHGRIGSGAGMERINVELVSGTYFPTLGVNAIAGRLLTAADDRTPGGHPVAVASYAWWQRRFANSPRMIGEAVTIGATVYTLVGVAPPGFFGVTVGQSPDVWIPLAMEKEISPGWNGLEDKLFQSLYLIGRRKTGVEMAQANANTNVLFRQILRGYVGEQPSPKELESVRQARIDLVPAATGLSPIRARFSAPLKILMIAVALVLLIACANVANLLLARAASRRREIAVRMSIGAGRPRLIRQLLVENALVGVTGGALGALMAWRGSALLVALVDPESQALAERVEPNATVLFFTLGISLLTVLLFGLAPAFQATRVQLIPALKDGRGAAGLGSRNRLSRGLIVAQVALSLTLVAGAGLFLRSFLNLMNVDMGFDRQNVLVIGVDPGSSGYRVDARLESMMERVEERVSAQPGVKSASFAFSTFGGGWTNPVIVAGRRGGESPDVFQNIVGPDYLRVMRTPILLGRSLDRRDNVTGRKVAVINEAMTRAYFEGGPAIGRTFSIGDEPEWQNIEVVGVAGDAAYMSLRDAHMPAAFYPYAQHGMFLYNLVVRYSGDARSAVAAVREAVRGIDPNLAASEATTFKQLVEGSVLNQRLVAQLVTAFGVLAAFLAAVGIYGVVSYGVSRRTDEFGIRMALGAERGAVLWMVVREASRLAMIGVGAGAALAIACGRLVQAQLFGVKWFDPLSMAVALAAMIAIALLAAFVPARRVTRIDPMVALRYE